jgi:hydrogenase assembly chaperone HypC/HupF
MCVTRPHRLLEVAHDGTWGILELGGREQRVSLAVLGSEGVMVKPGDWVLVNSGLPVERIEAGEAEELLDLLREAGLGSGGGGLDQFDDFEQDQGGFHSIGAG